VTYKSWEHTWLGEGWASYAEALWAEHAAGDDPARAKRAYQRQIAANITTERLTNRTFAPLFPALASNRYNSPIEVFMRANNVYSKGAAVLHMLRMRLGDEVFRRAAREYIERYKFKEVETDDFRRVLEDVSGLSLEQFFDQWVGRPGTPRLEFELSWDEAASELTISAAQTQQIDADNPAYALSIPIEVDLGETRKEVLRFDVDTRTATRAYTLASKPVDVTIDPEMVNAAWTRVKKPLAMWLRQAEHPSVFARLEAIRHLAESGHPAAGRVLAATAATDDRDDPVRLAASVAVVARAARLLASRLTPPPFATRLATLNR
jgi:aminopeptidase N